MTIHDFFKLALRLFAFVALIGVLFTVPYTFGFSGDEIDWMSVAYMVFVVTFSIWLFQILITKSEFIVTRLGLAKGFQENRIPFEKLDAITLIQVGIIFEGCFIFFEAIPSLLTEGYYFVRYAVAASEAGLDYNEFKSRKEIIKPVISLFVGILMLTNSDRLARLLLKQ